MAPSNDLEIRHPAIGLLGRLMFTLIFLPLLKFWWVMEG